MKTLGKLFILLFIFSLSNTINAQIDTLKSSIGYSNTLNNNSFGNRINVDIDSVYPKDLSNASLFYIEINKEDIYGNKGLFGLSYKKINSKLISKMKSKYPYKFDAFPNEYRLKGKDFFIEKGYKYRLLVQSTWYQVWSSQSNGYQWKQNFAVVIQDIETNIIYGNKDWYWFNNYIEKFIKTLN